MTPPDAKLRDKVALVTGGASGIGRATAFALAEAGAELVVADVDEDGGRAVAAEVGGEFLRVDVSSLDENREMVRYAEERMGGIDLAVPVGGDDQEGHPFRPDRHPTKDVPQ